MKMNDSVVVSVVVPIYNTASYVKKCIQSIMDQTYEKIEVILIDDGSMDGSDMICRSFLKKDKRIKYIRQENSGVVRARMTGIDQASGEYLLFIDSDDWIDSDMIEHLVGNIEEADMVTAGVHYEVQAGVVVEYMDKYPEGIYDLQNIDGVLQTMIFDMETKEMQRLTP